MEIRNDSNYPKYVEGVRIEPGETEDVDMRGRNADKWRENNSFTVLDGSETTSDEEVEQSEDDATAESAGNDDEESSKPEENSKDEGD